MQSDDLSTENLNLIEVSVLSDSAMLVIFGRLSGVGSGVELGLGDGDGEDSGDGEGEGDGDGEGLGDGLVLGVTTVVGGAV